MLTVIETAEYLKQAAKLFSEAERAEIVDVLSSRPEAGDVIQGTGGLRKLRWKREGKGKRGGVRIIYYYHNRTMPLALVYAYAKSAKEDLTPHEKKALTAIIATFFEED
jgi:hypothetical protein